MEMRKRSGVPWIWRVEQFEGRLWRNTSCAACLLGPAVVGCVDSTAKTEDQEVDPAAAVAARGDSGAGPAAAGALPYETIMS